MCVGEVKQVCRDDATYRGLVEFRMNLSGVKSKRRNTKWDPAELTHNSVSDVTASNAT
jgi:hypothetical protein